MAAPAQPIPNSVLDAVPAPPQFIQALVRGMIRHTAQGIVVEERSAEHTDSQ